MATAWDPANFGPSFTISGSNLIATHAALDGSFWRCGLADTGRSTGKLCFEIVVTALPDDSAANWTAGFSKNDQTITSYIGASGTDGYVRADMTTYDGSGDGGVTYTTGNRGFTTATPGDVLTFLLDLDAGKAWVIKNDDAAQKAQAAAGTNPTWTWTPGGVWFPIHGSSTAGSSVDAVATLHSVIANQAYTPPSGFTDWDGGGGGGGGFFARHYYDQIIGGDHF